MACADADEVDAIVDLVDALTICHARPEAFHVTRDEATRRLKALALKLRTDPHPGAGPTTVWRGR